jgi:alpha-amylase/alpha-mannosidase (GH57 family)
LSYKLEWEAVGALWLSNVEAYIVPETPIAYPGDKLIVSILAETSRTTTANLYSYRGLVAQLELKPGMVEYAVEIYAPRIPGYYELVLRTSEAVLDRVKFRVVDVFNITKRYLALVWHHHQAPNYLPNGVYHALWAFTHTYRDELAPYSKGPYYHHAVVLNEHREYKCTYNLSPSLIAQWVELVERGVKHRDGFIDPNSPEAVVVKRTLELYREAARREQIDVLTSMYAHSIAGYLLDYLGADDIVKEELESGIEITRGHIGIEPRGVWTPEMAFHMKLVDIYSDLGLEYTVLDDKCHLTYSTGEKGNHLEPYLVKGEKGSLIVFFRDHELSNILGFKSNFKGELHAVRSAYDVVLRITERVLSGGLLVIALDGENWMIFSQKPPLTALFYEKLVSYLEKCQRAGYLELSTLGDLTRKLVVKRTLSSIPTTSWLCSFTKWHGEVKEHSVYWERVRRVYSALREYESKCSKDEVSAKARWALWHALDSDYWWAEFWNPEVIDAWLRFAESLLESITLRTPQR